MKDIFRNWKNAGGLACGGQSRIDPQAIRGKLTSYASGRAVFGLGQPLRNTDTVDYPSLCTD